MLLDSTIFDLTSEKGVPHLMPSNPSGSELGLKPELDFCPQPKIPTTNDKMATHFPRFLILELSVVYQDFGAFLPNQDSLL
jgi:hypothetical protein